MSFEVFRNSLKTDVTGMFKEESLHKTLDILAVSMKYLANLIVRGCVVFTTLASRIAQKFLLVAQTSLLVVSVLKHN